MTLEDHLRRMIGDLVLTAARLAAEVDALTERANAPVPHVSPAPPDAGQTP